MKRLALPLGIMITAGLAQGLGGDTAMQEAGSLLGTWSLVSLEVDGKKLTEEFVASTKLKVTFQTNGHYQFVAANHTQDSGQFWVNLKSSPKELDLVATDDAGKKITYRGIYKIEGQKLLTCMPNMPSGERPKTFQTSPGSNTRTAVFQCVKP